MASLLQWATTYTGPVGKDDIHEIFSYCLRRTLGALGSGINQIPELKQKTEKLGWDKQSLRKYIFNTVVNDNGAPRVIEINKRNIEFRTGTEASRVFVPMDDPEAVYKFYDLEDIFLDLIVYRVGRYSYYAAQVTPFFKDATENPRVVLENTVD